MLQYCQQCKAMPPRFKKAVALFLHTSNRLKVVIKSPKILIGKYMTANHVSRYALMVGKFIVISISELTTELSTGLKTLPL